MEEIEKETRPRVRKRKNKLVIIGGKEVVGRSIWKQKGSETIFKFLENNRDKKKRKSKGKRDRFG